MDAEEILNCIIEFFIKEPQLNFTHRITKVFNRLYNNPELTNIEPTSYEVSLYEYNTKSKIEINYVISNGLSVIGSESKIYVKTDFSLLKSNSVTIEVKPDI